MTRDAAWIGLRGWAGGVWDTVCGFMGRVAGRGGAVCDGAGRDGARKDAARGEPRHPFDQRHGMDTGGLIYGEDLGSGHPHDVHSAGYYATAPSLFEGAVAAWRETVAGTGFELSDYALVDVGCGKGRVVMLAAEHPFREVVGLELNPELARVARKNLRRWMRAPRACRSVRIVAGDAVSVPFPDGPVVFFFFNSFEREMVELLLGRLADLRARRAAPVDLIYVHPEFGHCIRQTPGADLVAEAEVVFSAEDAGADAFGVAMDECEVYRMATLVRGVPPSRDETAERLGHPLIGNADESSLDGSGDGLCPVVGAELLKATGNMISCRLITDKQPLRNLFIG
jgi:SAM-dependent methyltransferase